MSFLAVAPDETRTQRVMSSDIDFERARFYAIPLATQFRGIMIREGLLIEGPAGWGEFCPFENYDDRESAAWLATAVEACTVGWPAPVRDRIPINCTVAAVEPDRAHQIAATSGCATAKVKVADHPDSLAEDLARVEAVRDALGPLGTIRVDANAAWDVDTAVKHIGLLNKAAGGLEYVEQPCRTLDELAAVRRRVDVRIAADESIRPRPRPAAGRGRGRGRHRGAQVHPARRRPPRLAGGRSSRPALRRLLRTGDQHRPGRPTRPRRGVTRTGLCLRPGHPVPAVR